MQHLTNNFIRPAIVALTAILLGHCHTACKPPGGSAMEADYNQQLLACVNNAKSLQESCSCRLAVDNKFGLCDHPQYPGIGRCDYRCEKQ